MKISEVAAQAGVNIQTLRYYERRGIVEEPERTRSGYRQYPPDTVRLIRFIKRAQDLGFTLEEVEELLRLRDSQGKSRSEVRAIAEAKIRDIDQKLVRLKAILRALNSLVEACACEQRPTCSILEALDDPKARPRRTNGTR